MTSGRFSCHLKSSQAPDLHQLRGLTPSQIVHYPWDRLAFGYQTGDLLPNFPLSDLVPDPQDMKNVTGQSMRSYFDGIPYDELPPIEGRLSKGKMHIEDGHHRYGYAKELGTKTVPVLVASIDDNPMTALGLDMDEIIRKYSAPANKGP